MLRVIASALLALLFASCVFGDDTPDGPLTAVFSDEATCQSLTGDDACGFVRCDDISGGASLDEVCGPYFQEGMTASDLDDEQIRDLVDRWLVECWTAEDPVDGVLHVEDGQGGWVRLGGPDGWLDDVARVVGRDCEA